MSTWLLFVLSLPGSNAAPRMRIWRGLKALGAGVLRDGVYVLPRSEAARRGFDDQARAVTESGGTGEVLECESSTEHQEQAFRALFDRAETYDAWMARPAALRDALATLDEASARREEAQARRALEAIEGIDFFPGEERERARRAMQDLSATINARFSPGEPTASSEIVERRDPAGYAGREWATRQNLWVDRVASAWLVRRFIDPGARFRWLEQPAECPPGAVGFDFDGAEFSHAGHRVTFEVLLAAFGLEGDVTLAKIGALVHYLDTGGVPVAEAAGFVALLAGARRRSDGDDAFLESAGRMLDDLYGAYACGATAAPAPSEDGR